MKCRFINKRSVNERLDCSVPTELKVERESILVTSMILIYDLLRVSSIDIMKFFLFEYYTVLCIDEKIRKVSQTVIHQWLLLEANDS